MGAAGSTHASHPEHPLELKDYKKPYTCDGCKEPGFGSRYRCEACNFNLHKGCMFPTETTTHDFFGNASFTFLPRPSNPKCKEKRCKNDCKRYCDACGKAVNGFVYHCAAQNLDLHPCCRNLETKMDIGGVELWLQDKVSRRCNWCGKRDLKGRCSGVQGWAYASSNGDFYFHLRCVREAWQNEGGSHVDNDGDDKSVAVIKMKLQLQHNSKRNGGSGKRYWKMLKSILKIIMCVLLGDPTIALASVVTESLLSK